MFWLRFIFVISELMNGTEFSLQKSYEFVGYVKDSNIIKKIQTDESWQIKCHNFFENLKLSITDFYKLRQWELERV